MNFSKIKKIIRVSCFLTAMFIVFGMFAAASAENAAIKRAGGYKLELKTERLDFSVNEAPEMRFVFNKERRMFAGLAAWLMSMFIDEYGDMAITAETAGPGAGDREKFTPVVTYIGDGEFTVSAPGDVRDFRPGKYSVKINIVDDDITGGETVTFSQDFTWGVLAFNVNKSVYLPGETAYLQLGVLDDLGHTLCDAGLYLEITAPDGGVAYLDTDNGLVVRNPECGPDNVITTPDYFGFYGLAGAGDYDVKITAHTANGERTVYDRFEARDSLPFEIERTGPTRINPAAAYGMRFRVKANENFTGDITEFVPAGFELSESTLTRMPLK